MKEYEARRITHSLVINGDLTKEEWKQTQAVTLVDTITGQQPRLSTTVRLLWNETYLYAAFSCEDDHIASTYTQFNDPLFEEDAVELFIDDDCDEKSYIEIEMNPLGAILHYFILNDNQGTIYPYARIQNGTVSAVQRDNQSGKISYELAIPLAEFVTAPHQPPRPGDVWRINLYRIDRELDGGTVYSAWSSTGRANFHVPGAFGRLLFTT